jgi:hypothetical protein
MTVTVPHYVTTDGSGRWTGTGAPLSATQFDEDLYTLQAAVNGISLTPGVGVASISQPTAGTLLFTMTDATTAGPFVLPAGAQWNFRGNWAASTAYAVDDVFEQNGTIYAVIWPHTSASTFASGANDGLGHNYYIVRLNLPSDVLPAGGATGQALVKVSGTDYDCGWATLLKASNNLSDLVSASTARTNLGLGAVATLSTVPVANGGTGTTTPSIVAGSNITVSGTWPNQTIDAAGGGFSPIISSPADGDIIKYSAGDWINAPPSAGDLTWVTSSASRTLALTDAHHFIGVITGGTQTYTVPPGSSVAFPVGTVIALNQYYSGGGGSFTVAPGSGVVLHTAPGLSLNVSKQYGTAYLRYVGASGGSDYWLVSGDLDPAIDTISGTGAVGFDPTVYGEVAAITPAGSMTISAYSVMVKSFKMIFTTSGTSSYTITFGTNFKSAGTLSTGTVSGKVFVVDFIGNGVNYNEVSRSGPL